jgi:hypothetical protein
MGGVRSGHRPIASLPGLVVASPFCRTRQLGIRPGAPRQSRRHGGLPEIDVLDWAATRR